MSENVARASGPRRSYTPYEGSNSDNNIGRKLGVFDRTLEGSQPIFINLYCYFEI